ncbi:allophanate hydrolase subunit 2 [Lanmaoa asiatica]|nr:allophanate hydrolase subunit 2 [Lanmaoa asiatica]
MSIRLQSRIFPDGVSDSGCPKAGLWMSKHSRPPTESLEIVTLPGVGCQFMFHVPCVVAVTGKSITVKVDREQVPMWARLVVPAKGTLEIRGEPTKRFRVYLAIRGGFPEALRYLVFKSTSMGLGGYQGRALKPGDQIALGHCWQDSYEIQNLIPFVLPTTLVPVHPTEWVVNVLSGPHDDDKYLMSVGSTSFYSAQWTISSSSDRMGIRLQSHNRM